MKRTKERPRAEHAVGLFGGLIVDNFAGGGGAPLGLERAFGRAVDISINHDPEAIAMHATPQAAKRRRRQAVAV